MNTKVIITAEDQTGAGIASVKSSMDGLGVAAQAWSGVLNGAFAGLASALSAGAFMSWIKSSIDAADSMNDLSQRLGIAVRDLGTWSLAAAQSGTSMAAIGVGVKSLSGFMARHSEELQKAGITATDANGAMIQLADLFAAMPDGIDKTALATKLFGRSGAELIPMLNEGSAGLEKVKNKAADYAARLGELAPLADEFNDLLEELALQTLVTGLTFAKELIGPLIQIVELFKDARSGVDGFHNAMKRMQTLTNSGPLSMFGTAAALSEKGGVGQRVAALAGIGGDDAKRGASGLIVGGAGDMARFDEATERYLKENEARLRAKALLNKAKTEAEQGKKSGRPFDPEGDLWYAIEEAQRKKHRAALDATDKALDRDTAALEKMRKRYVEMADPLQKYRDELDQINMLRANGKLTADQALEAEWQVGEAMDAAAKKMTGMGEAMKENSTFAHDMGLSFSSAFENAALSGKKLSEVLQALGKDIAGIVFRKSITEPMGNALSGMLKGFDFGSLLKFDGGGDTGGGARSGGLDGQGGFLAIMHPQETVIDHARGGSGGGTSNHFTVDMRGASVEAVARLEQLVMSVNGSIERRAMNVMSQARVRGA